MPAERLVQLHGGLTPQVIALLAGAMGALIWFVVRQRRLGHAVKLGIGNAPLMDQALFTHRQFAMGSIVAFIYGMALFGSTYLLPVYMQLGFATLTISRRHDLAARRCGAGRHDCHRGRLADRYATHLLVSVAWLCWRLRLR